MIGASKILTVSYGTFSCTLEGFDDPFNTMRAIAEYFRDLAAEDRYFGAEPPTPDAAMLLKIAEREVQRRVEAKIQDNGVVLRTGEAMESPSAAAVVQPVVPVTPAISAPPPAAQSAPMPEGVAAKLLRIRAAVANAELVETRTEMAPAPVVAEAASVILDDYSEDQHADEIAATTTLTATFAPDAFSDADFAGDIWVQPAANLEDTDYGDEIAMPDDADLTAELPQDEALVGENRPSIDTSSVGEAVTPPPQVDEGDYARILTALETNAASGDDGDDLVAVSVNPADMPSFDDAEDGESNEDYAITDDELADLRALDGDAVAPASVESAETSSNFGFDEEGEDDFEADVDAREEAEETAVTLSGLAPDFEDEPASLDLPPIIDPMIEEIDSVYDTPDAAPAAGPSEKALRARARVIKVRRDEIVEDPAPAAAEDAANLAAEAEADLRRELRALQQQDIAATPVETGDVDANSGTDVEAEEDDAHPRLNPTGEAAVSRLIEQTNEAMAVPENRRRLSAIAHLKAAVAATVADRFAKGGATPTDTDEERLDPYRDDLARVVRPQRPGASDDTPSTPRPAPLVLVSAQRIDRPRTAPTDSSPPTLAAVPSSPVRPRRVTSAVLAVEPTAVIDEEEDEGESANVFADTRGFAEFSERLGANSLAEILEAAAAYSVCIEGRPYFSRPQLMSQIGALSADSEYSREDGLRTFGSLLREGRIQKIKRGQFVLTESSRYLAEARALAG